MTDSQQAYHEQLLHALLLEKKADAKAFEQNVRNRPLSERVAEGLSWHPVRVAKTGFALGEKAYVIVERTSRINEPHQFRSGQSVCLFSTASHLKEPEKNGIINFVDRNRMKIVLHSRDIPDWIDAGHLGVDLLFDDRSYREMEQAVKQLLEAKGNRLSELKNILTGKKQPSFFDYTVESENEPSKEELWDWHDRYSEGSVPESAMPRKNKKEGAPIDHLNESQQEAVRSILGARDVAVIHGPPGTGKTTTLVAAITHLCVVENTVLVTAPSNTAADLLTERLAEQDLNVIRVGNISRVDESVLSHTLDAVLAAHPESKNLKKVKIQAAEYRRQARKFKRHFGHEERREREHLKKQARELEDWAGRLEDRMVEQILTGAQAIVCTLVGAAHPILAPFKFRTCVIDEAAQALEPAAWIPILKSSRVVLAGDPFQLPPTVKSKDAEKAGLSVTLIERCLDMFPDQVNLLDTQYRMHQTIMGFSNNWFYQNELKAHESVKDRMLFSKERISELTESPVVFIDTAGCGFEEQMVAVGGGSSGHSRFNPEEALLIREHLIKLMGAFPEKFETSIGILSPYRGQVDHLHEVFSEDNQFKPYLSGKKINSEEAEPTTGITINTIDGFQGQERAIVYISLVRSNPKNDIGFLRDFRRMNVAMTRAQKLLVVVGDSATIGNNPFYEAFLDYCSEHGKYDTAWSYLQ